MRVGVIGGGQLAQMLAEAAIPMGIKLHFLVPSLDCPVSRVAEVEVGDYRDPEVLQAWVSGLDVLTYESENTEISVLENLTLKIHPPLQALKITQDRYQEKSFANALQIPTAPFKLIDSFHTLKLAVETLGFPTVLKTCRGGYDGKGQFVLNNEADLEPAWNALSLAGTCVLESFLKFDRELSLIGVRSEQGEVTYYPLIENHHSAGILRESKAPFDDPQLENLAQLYAGKMMDALNYVGVICLEFFQQGEQLILNEVAPRVHNSGHWTIEGATTSQFENHLRAILGLKLGSTESRGSSKMINYIGEWPADRPVREGYYWHDYGKEPKVGRKLGHLTIVSGKWYV